MKRFTLTTLSLLAATPLMAHPGHDAPVATHWFSDMSHLAVMGLLAALIVVLAGAVLRRRAPRRTKE
jgi:hypothetical protein